MQIRSLRSENSHGVFNRINTSLLKRRHIEGNKPDDMACQAVREEYQFLHCPNQSRLFVLLYNCGAGVENSVFDDGESGKACLILLLLVCRMLILLFNNFPMSYRALSDLTNCFEHLAIETGIRHISVGHYWVLQIFYMFSK